MRFPDPIRAFEKFCDIYFLVRNTRMRAIFVLFYYQMTLLKFTEKIIDALEYSHFSKLE